MHINAIPVNGFAESGTETGWTHPKATHHNVATAAFDVGTKVRYFNAHLSAWGTCIYLRYSKGGETLAAGMLCQPDPVEDSLYYVTGDCSTFVDLAVWKPNCMALSAMTTTFYGWFWCGGICPDFFTAASTRFDEATCVTDNSLTAGDGFTNDGAQSGDTDGTLVAYKIGAIHTGENFSQAGWVLADDGGSSTDMGNLVLIDWWP